MGDAAEEGSGIGFGHGDETVFLLFGQHEEVEFATGPSGVGDLRPGRVPRLLEGPVPGWVRNAGVCGVVAWIRGAQGDPVFQGCDFLRCEGPSAITFGRHGIQIPCGTAHRLDQEAFGGFAGQDGGTAGAALLPSGTGIESESALELGGLGGVAGVAVFGEERSDLLFEELQMVGFEAKDHGDEGESEGETEGEATRRVTAEWGQGSL